jgi:hypothetical protein
MSSYMQCFSIDEVLLLDEHQLSLLRLALEREVRNSPEIKRILRASIQPLYDQMVSPSKSRKRGSRRPSQRRRGG